MHDASKDPRNSSRERAVALKKAHPYDYLHEYESQ